MADHSLRAVLVAALVPMISAVVDIVIKRLFPCRLEREARLRRERAARAERAGRQFAHRLKGWVGR